MAEIALKTALGAAAILAVQLLSQSGNERFAGLAVFFPVITVAALVFIEPGSDNRRAAEVVWSSVAALPVWLTFAATLLVALPRLPLLAALGAACLAWLGAATVFVAVQA